VPSVARLSRLPIRLRLTLAFTAATALVLGATGIFVYHHLKSGLDSSIDQSLRDRSDDVVTLVDQVGPRRLTALRTPLERGGSYAQVIDARGRVLDASSGAGRPLLTAAEIDRARRATVRLQRGESERLLARPVRTADGVAVVVVGTSLDQREHAMETLAGALLIGGALALLLVGTAGYGLVAGALRPVELMRRRARTISAERAGARLPLPPADDEIRRLGETLNEMLGRLEAGLLRERAFVADASHELRTPLAILKMELELALREGSTPDELVAALRSAAEETDRLTRLADDLLVLARADDGRLPMRPAAVDVRTLLEGVGRRFAARAAEAGRPIVVDAPGGLVVDGDALRLEQALGNLVDNALTYGGGAVRLAAARAGDGVELVVADEGEGFPGALLPRAFERFSRADAARSRAGAGLGLAIVAAVARAHGGCTRAVNVPGGAEVHLALPAARSRAPARAWVSGPGR
jgi:signal transduction histidine kinase